MKKSILIGMLAVSMSLIFNACNNSSPKSSAVDLKAASKEVYTCSMHPEVRSDEPGKCPKCGMELVKMETADTTHMNNQSDTIHNN